MKNCFIIFTLISLLNSCTQEKSIKNETKDSLSLTVANTFDGIWKLNYYPDSIIANKSIDDNSKWSSSYAYCVKIKKDSCELIGWNEKWKTKFIKVDEYNYRTEGENQYWELKFDSIPDKKILFKREVYIREGKTRYYAYFPYTKINEELNNKIILDRINQELFVGSYKLLFNDTLKCDSIIEFKKDFNISGIDSIESYEITIDLLDNPMTNLFGFRNINKQHTHSDFTFKFDKDTLFLRNYTFDYDKSGEWSGSHATQTRMKLLKLKN